MDNRKLRYAKRKAKEKILSQRDRAYYRNLNFRENPNEQVEVSPETYAAQNASLYGRKYADTVKAQGRKLFIRQKEREWQRKKRRGGGLQAETLSSSESTLHQPAEKRAGMQANSGTVNANLNRRQNLQARRKKQVYISSVLREKGYSDRKYALPIFSRKSKGTGAAGVKNIKTLSKGTKKVISLILTGGGAMLLLLALCGLGACTFHEMCWWQSHSRSSETKAARSTGGGTDLTVTLIGAPSLSVGVQTKRACWKQTACPNTRSAMRGFAGSSKRGNGITERLSRNRV